MTVVYKYRKYFVIKDIQRFPDIMHKTLAFKLVHQCLAYVGSYSLQCYKLPKVKAGLHFESKIIGHKILHILCILLRGIYIENKTI